MMHRPISNQLLVDMTVVRGEFSNCDAENLEETVRKWTDPGRLTRLADRSCFLLGKASQSLPGYLVKSSLRVNFLR